MVVAQEDRRETTHVCIKGPSDDDGLDALISGHAAQRVDEKRKIEAVGERKFGELLKKYELYLKGKYSFIRDNQLSDWVNDVLTPNDINEFLQATREFEKHIIFSITGKFITQLIQNSYDAGYNNFIINTKALTTRIDDLCENREGSYKRVIYLQIDGNIGYYCCSKTKYFSVTINGNVDNGCGYCAENSSFIINGNFEPFNFGNSATSCNFKTKNRRTLKKLLKYVQKDRFNKVYFINPDGTEELKRKN